VDTPVRIIAVPQKFLRHASRSQVLAELGMDAPGIAESIRGWCTPNAGSPAHEDAQSSVSYLRASGDHSGK